MQGVFLENFGRKKGKGGPDGGDGLVDGPREVGSQVGTC